MEDHITRMLEAAYDHLKAPEKKKWTRQAVSYLLTDRQHYIQLADPDTPEYQISLHLGIICYRVPLAIRLSKQTHKDAVCHQCQILHLVVMGEKAEYAIETSSRWEYKDPEKENYRYPVYRRTGLTDLEDGFLAMEPEKIVPSASRRQREIFGMIFTAIAKFGAKLHINAIPDKTERAMFTIPMAPEKAVPVDGKPITGKWIPLARENAMYEEYREDHRYSWSRELGLVVTSLGQFYVLKTHHVYRYFRKIPYDDIPGEFRYEEAGEKQEATYQRVELDQVLGDLSPLYN